MKSSVIKMLTAVAVFAMPAVANVSTYQPLNYTTVFYGDHIKYEWTDTDLESPLPSVPYVVHNRSATVWGDLFPDGFQHVGAGIENGPRTLTGGIGFYADDGVSPYHTSCGKSSAVILGSWLPLTTGFSSGTPLFVNMSVTPYGNYVGDYENFYFKMFNGNQLLTELNKHKMVDTVYFRAGDRLRFEMYALEDDFYDDGYGYSRNLEYSAVVGGPVTVPEPCTMLLGGLGISLVGMFRKNIQRG